MIGQNTEIRSIDIDGETDWLWVREDTGSFGDEKDGPMADWLNSHRFKYFQYLKTANTIVTAGTCCGMHVRFYQKLFKNVYAFEPEPTSFYCMTFNAQGPNVRKFNAALSDSCGQINMQTAAAGGSGCNIGMHHADANGNLTVQTLTIDSLNLAACDLIQLDVEGSEMAVIRGATETISKYRPVVIAERFESDEAVAFMSELGYDLIDRSAMDSIYLPR